MPKKKGFCPKGFYNLADVKEKIDKGQVRISPDVLHDAYNDFGWNAKDIVEVYKMLKPNHFYKTATSAIRFSIFIDCYKARLKNESVYTHFYFDDDFLIINSFKANTDEEEVMYCEKCGCVYRERTDQLEVIDPYVGPIIVDGISFYKCENCGDILYTLGMAEFIEQERDRRLSEIIGQFPIRDFVNASQSSLILGITRQALHKNRRIRRGFIYQTINGGSIFYLKQSVLQYKKTGDGRFPISLRDNVYQTDLEETVELPMYASVRLGEATNSPFKDYHVSVEENSYAK